MAIEKTLRATADWIVTGAAITTDHPAVSLVSVGKRFGQRWVVKDVSFDLPHGQSIALVGLNGAGKTSLLRMMLNFSRPSSGSILVYGKPSTQVDARKLLAYLPERFVPPTDLTGSEVLEMLAGLRGQTVDATLCSRRLTELELPSEALARPVRQLSKGMTQKLGLCAVLLANCPLTILDEPFSGLDPVARRCVSRALERLRREGRSVLFTSHSLIGIENQCDHIGVVHGGGLRFFGDPKALLQRYSETDIESAFIRCLDQTTATCDD